jgi:hypothetical protein
MLDSIGADEDVCRPSNSSAVEENSDSLEIALPE